MAAIMRLGIQIPPADPFWVQMREAIVQHAQPSHFDIVPIETELLVRTSSEHDAAILELLLTQELDAIVCHLLPTPLLQRILQADIPVIYLNEHTLHHPRFVTTVGLYESTQLAMRFIVHRLRHRGAVALVGEFATGRSRLAAACGTLQASPRIAQYHLPCPWNNEQACVVLAESMTRIDRPIDALLGFSDGLALVARDVGRSLGIVDDSTLIVGIDGDPLAIAAIAQGTMTATVELAPIDLGRQVVEVAYQAAHRLPLPRHCRYVPKLVTQENVTEVAAKKLIAMAHLPSHLVGVNRQQEQHQLAKLEINQMIHRQVTGILDRATLVSTFVQLVRARYRYDEVRLLRCSPQDGIFLDEFTSSNGPNADAICDPSGVLTETIAINDVLFIPNIHRSHRFGPDPAWPSTVSRVVVPIHIGEQITGLLDLHLHVSRPHTRQDLIGLQSLADQLGTALRNAELYEDALQARASAERADGVKTRLLANVSHELRTPLNVILGYTETILTQPRIYAEDLPQTLLNDLRHVYQSSEHLIHLINDLLDLSRAEIGALDIYSEMLDPHTLLREVFESMATRTRTEKAVQWRLDLPHHLPLVEVDPVRLRQIVFNLLSNAEKVTTHGQITLGARVEPPSLQIWVTDTGAGIPLELHERIFEPFVTGQAADRSKGGIGLGLSIVRQLVALHGGSMRLESEPGRGSTFRIFLPLPRLHAQSVSGDHLRPRAMLLVATSADDQALARVCRQQNVLPHHVAHDQHIDRLFATIQPIALVCNVDNATAHDWDLIEQIRQHPKGSMLPLVLYSPQDAASDDSSWLTRVLVKPLRSTQLLDIVTDLQSSQELGTVLIVDDDPDTCAFYQQLVATVLPNASVRVAIGGGAALAFLEHEVPSLLILDLVMPGVDGFAVMERVRGNEQTRHVPVLVLSGKVLSPEDVQRLSHHHVIYHSKDLLAADELAAQLRRIQAGTPMRSLQTSRLVKRVVAYLQEHHHRSLSREEISDALGISQSYLSEIFQHELALTPWEYLNRYRIKQAKILLQDTTRTITEVANSVGFNDPSYFGRVFRRIVGCSPQQYRSPERMKLPA